MMRAIYVIALSVVCGLASAKEPSAGNSANNEAKFSYLPDIVLLMRRSAFDVSAHLIHRCKVVDWDGVCLIDGKPVIGADWTIPKSMLASANLKIKGALVALDVSSLYNPWNGAPKKEFFSVDSVEGGWRVRGCFSDGAGSYVAEWLVVAGSSIRTLISNDESVMEPFPCNSTAKETQPNPTVHPDSAPAALRR